MFIAPPCIYGTYKHGGDVVGERVGDDGEAGRDEGSSTKRLDHTNHQTCHGERDSVRTAVNEPCVYRVRHKK